MRHHDRVADYEAMYTLFTVVHTLQIIRSEYPHIDAWAHTERFMRRWRHQV